MTTSRSYKITVRLNAQEIARLTRYRGDAPLTTYIRLAALRDTDRKEREETSLKDIFGTDTMAAAPPFGGGKEEP